MESEDSGTLLTSSPRIITVSCRTLSCWKESQDPCVEHGNDTKAKTIRDRTEKCNGNLATSWRDKITLKNV